MAHLRVGLRAKDLGTCSYRLRAAARSMSVWGCRKARAEPQTLKPRPWVLAFYQLFAQKQGDVKTEKTE